MSYALADDRAIRSSNMNDDYNLVGLAVDLYLPMLRLRFIRTLEQNIEWRGKPAMISVTMGQNI